MIEFAPPALLGSALGLGLFDASNTSSVMAFVDKVQAQLTGLASLLPPPLTVAGPNVIAATGPDGSPMLRIGIWFLGAHSPTLAAPDPTYPHTYPVLTPGSALKGFSATETLGIPPVPAGIGASFGIGVSTSALNVIVQGQLPALRAQASSKGVTLSTLTVSCSAGGNVSATFEGDAGFPTGAISGTVTETLGVVANPTTGKRMPAIIGHSSSAGTDVGNQVLLAFATVLAAPAALGAPFLLEAIGFTVGAPIAASVAAGYATALATAFVGMLPATLPFQIPNNFLPDFPQLVFDWPVVGTTASGSGITAVGSVVVPVTSRPSPPTLTLTGPARLDGTQTDFAGGAAAGYTVTWAEIAPDQVLDPVTHLNHNAQGFGWRLSGGSPVPLTAGFPFSLDFAADFPLPNPVLPGVHNFTLTVAALETSGRDPSLTLSPSASIEVEVNVVKDSPGPQS